MKKLAVFFKKYWALIFFGLIAAGLVIAWIVIFDDTYMPKDRIEDIIFYENCSDYVYDASQENRFTVLQTESFKYEEKMFYIENGNLYSEDLSSREGRNLISGDVESFAVVNGAVYYLTEEGLLRTNTKNSIVLINNIDDHARTVWVSADSIFFCNEDANICRTDKNGNNTVVISEKGINDFIIRDNKSFYTEVYYDGYDCYTLLYAMNADGTNDQMLVEMSVEEFDVIDNVVYMTEAFEEKKYKLDLKSGELMYD